ncbi:sulfotransferase family protein [Myceligenerans pegani]|uniref:Sulfotransferase family protein n=1 Tax=Myceligenerans pegani TaxID=2776917 RepID=A0ABR9N712_9MICO|nr:sulfotransferase family protein [Myceligenerans sp. TRM 65318]MBE1878918.1 sulfotransferase family protein [Myceligenerans sp. TRM 65318]MBE3021189.1 sulfotransferase family protein [Myceligenerans sp. TRM 65318]
MKIIGAGLPRTGTSSLKAALDRLGFGPCYHMFELMRHPEHVERWRAVFGQESPDWGDVFAGYRSAVDFPAAIYWRELAEAYPEAKVVLTVRDPRRWYESVSTGMATVPDRMPGRMGQLAELVPHLNDAARRMLGDGFGLGVPMDEEKAVEIFERHVEHVRSALPADRLLVFAATDGWGPLCEFLGVDPPAGEPYPHLNDAETLRRMFTTMAESDELVTPFEARD